MIGEADMFLFPCFLLVLSKEIKKVGSPSTQGPAGFYSVINLGRD